MTDTATAATDWESVGFGPATDVPPEQPTPNPDASREPRGRAFGRSKKTDTGSKREARTRSANTRERKPRTTVPNRKGQFVEPLEGIYVMIGMSIMAVDPICGNAILASAGQCAVAVDDLAYRHEAVRRVIYKLVQTSALGAVIAAHMPIIMAILMHHVPAARNVLGVVGQQFTPTDTPTADDTTEAA